MNPIISQPTPSTEPAPGRPSASQPRELDLFAFVLMLLRHLPFILGCGAVALLFMTINMLRAKPRYASTAVMIVPQNSFDRKVSAELSMGAAGLLSGGTGSNLELYVDMVKSRTVADRIIDDYDLKTVYNNKNIEQDELTLASRTKIESEREGLIRVTVEDTSRDRAAALANDYFHQLDLLNSHLVLSSVGEERAYLERELLKEKDALADAEVALKQTQETTSGVPPEAVASAQLTALELTRVQLRGDQVKLDALLTGETEENPEVIRLRGEINGLTRQLSELQNGSASASNGTPTSQVPEQTLLYARRLRDVKFHEELYGLLEKEFEEAKQQEAKTPSIVQVLDPAVPSLHKAWPPRTYYCILAAIFGTVVGVVLVALWALIGAYMRHPENAEKLRQLKALYRK